MIDRFFELNKGLLGEGGGRSQRSPAAAAAQHPFPFMARREFARCCLTCGSLTLKFRFIPTFNKATLLYPPPPLPQALLKIENAIYLEAKLTPHPPAKYKGERAATYRTSLRLFGLE